MLSSALLFCSLLLFCFRCWIFSHHYQEVNREYHKCVIALRELHSYPARAQRALGLLLADGAPTVGGGRPFEPSAGFFTETAVTLERKVEKSIPRWEMNGHSEGYKRAIDQSWDCVAKIGFFEQKPRFWAQKKRSLLIGNHVLATTGKSCSKKKVAFAQIIITQNPKYHFGQFFGLQPIFRPKNTFQPNVKTSVSP